MADDDISGIELDMVNTMSSSADSTAIKITILLNPSLILPAPVLRSRIYPAYFVAHFPVPLDKASNSYIWF